MQDVVNNLLTQLASLLGPLSPFAKAVVPAALALATAVVKSAFDGKVNSVSVAIAVSGLVLAVVVYLVPNKSKVAVAPPKKAAAKK